MGYGLLAGHPGFDLQQGKLVFLYSIQTGSGIHPTFYPLGTKGLFSMGKVARA
jgi:hypothetical protein